MELNNEKLTAVVSICTGFPGSASLICLYEREEKPWGVRAKSFFNGFQDVAATERIEE